MNEEVPPRSGLDELLPPVLLRGAHQAEAVLKCSRRRSTPLATDDNGFTTTPGLPRPLTPEDLTDSTG
jgi:hypothetical protein